MGFSGLMIWDLNEAMKLSSGFDGGDIGLSVIDMMVGLSAAIIVTYMKQKHSKK